MAEITITELNLNSITISNSNLSNSKGFTAQSNTLQTNNAGVLLVNGVPISSGGGGAVDNIVEGDGIDVTQFPTGTFTITNTGVLALTQGANITITGSNDNLTIASTGGGGVDAVTAGTGINVTETPFGSGTFEIENIGVTSLIEGAGINLDFTTGDIEISSTVNPTDYYTVANADLTFQTLTDMGNYSTTTQADGLYQSQIGMANYSTTAQANALYETIANMVNYYTKTAVDTAFQSIAGMANYSTTVQANALYLPLNRVGVHQFLINTSVLTAGTIHTELFTIPNFNADINAAVTMTSNVIPQDGIAYVCNCEFTGNNGTSSDYTSTIANYSTVDGANNLRPFSIIVINP